MVILVVQTNYWDTELRLQEGWALGFLFPYRENLIVGCPLRTVLLTYKPIHPFNITLLSGCLLPLDKSLLCAVPICKKGHDCFNLLSQLLSGLLCSDSPERTSFPRILQKMPTQHQQGQYLDFLLCFMKQSRWVLGPSRCLRGTFSLKTPSENTAILKDPYPRDYWSTQSLLHVLHCMSLLQNKFNVPNTQSKLASLTMSTEKPRCTKEQINVSFVYFTFGGGVRGGVPLCYAISLVLWDRKVWNIGSVFSITCNYTDEPIGASMSMLSLGMARAGRWLPRSCGATRGMSTTILPIAAESLNHTFTFPTSCKLHSAPNSIWKCCKEHTRGLLTMS